MNEEYVIRRASRTGNGGAEKWDSSFWDGASELELSYVFPESSSNRPETRIKMLYDDSYIYGRFRVSGDLAVAAAATVDQQMVCRDSCVEFFVRPSPGGVYFNFEFNCCGVLLLYRIEDYLADRYREIDPETMKTIGRFPSLRREEVIGEVAGPVDWELGFSIPVNFFVKNCGVAAKLQGQSWRGNFTKCADATSQPHWRSWRRLSRLEFHLPDEFGMITFA